MQVTFKELIWRADIDVIRDSNGKEYQVMDITQDRYNLSVMLDTNPIEDRIVCFQDHGNWKYETETGQVHDVIDPDLLLFLKDLQATIPPLSIK